MRKLVGSVPLAKTIITFGAFGSCSVANMLVTASAAKTSLAHQLHIEQTHHPDEEVTRIREVARLATQKFKHAQRIKAKPEHELTMEEYTLRQEFSDGTLWKQMAEAHKERRRVEPPPGVLLAALMKE